ncbi:stage II sporulation protein M [Hazenella sp. IB182357]|uniref:Stage II sporulation protein M n=1 Tax=Polycladospora coralii TaxID=2771432 RepID=A0A926RYK2_9BACL|nr:stage II sporulation protein M [Polycladospora coralii]MBD1373591.1 stage II sporulation protein M [Polycladospora coralii]
MRKFLEALRFEKRYIRFLSVIFIVSALSGYWNGNDLLAVFKKAGIFDQLKEVVSSIQRDPSFFNVFLELFLNNWTAAMVTIVFGVFLVFWPSAMILMNGMLLGMVLKVAATESGVHPLLLFVKTILPHGIIEIPAIIIAAALGTHLGVFWIKWLISFSIPKRKEKVQAEWATLKGNLIPLLIGISCLVVLAGLIETGLILLNVT